MGAPPLVYLIRLCKLDGTRGTTVGATLPFHRPLADLMPIQALPHHPPSLLINPSLLYYARIRNHLHLHPSPNQKHPINSFVPVSHQGILLLRQQVLGFLPFPTLVDLNLHEKVLIRRPKMRCSNRPVGSDSIRLRQWTLLVDIQEHSLRVERSTSLPHYQPQAYLLLRLLQSIHLRQK